ncbi:DUF4412 domain-containing protein [Roseomonas sp. KE2513]|uniref:DUF4412 domain-containing protein n=1 Tax=Roseomonas sp. KE2513 TaxID=2479202 RepID=UPI0018DF58C6|nr:DUF4412 domain-containing protein [Roseomonas sp. KE2513]MBI0536362.1 DUF4412 domain-containing protein [Roseomonas sp. KE2513]
MLRIFVAAAVLALPGVAFAQGAPANIRPTRDVAVTYRLGGMPGQPNAGPQEMRMSWSITEGKQRVDPPGGMGWMLIDRRANSAVMVMEPQRMVLTLPADAAAAMSQDAPPNARFTRKGTAQVAGLSCQEWDVAVPQGTSTICVTEDGVMLRAASPLPDGSGTSRLEATEVRYGAQDATRFRVPDGFQTMQMPTQPPGGAQPSPGGAQPSPGGAAPARPAR